VGTLSVSNPNNCVLSIDGHITKSVKAVEEYLLKLWREQAYLSLK
ncbi:hypothetical protein TNCT_159371, partial [Trichonephila clavata]